MMMKSLRKPREGQKRALAASRGKDSFAFLMAMRTGKTKATLDDYVRLVNSRDVANLLVIAPGGVYETWVDAIATEIAHGPEVYVWRSGRNGKRERERRQEFLRSRAPRALLVNVEALSVVKEARDMVLGFLRSGPTYAAIDESTSIKNHAAARTKFVVNNVGQLAPYRRILSGLPTPRSPLDIYSQFDFLDQRIIGHRSFYTFRARYAKLKEMFIAGRRFKTVVGFQNLDELQERIAPYSFRLTLEECYDLPPSTYQARHVEMTDEQARVYEELRQFATSQLASETHVTATLVITQMLRLHQVLCGHVSDEEGVVREIPERRTRSLLELLEEYGSGKAIIWCSYDHDVQKLSHAIEHGIGKGKGTNDLDEEGTSNPVLRGFGKGCVARFWGGNRQTREEEERRFKTDPNCRFMIATPAAGGKGRTWDVADLVVYYSSTNNLEHRSQSEERPKGVGKDKSIGYVDLICRGTVDEKIVTALRAKIDLAAIIVGDDYKEWLV